MDRCLLVLASGALLLHGLGCRMYAYCDGDVSVFYGFDEQERYREHRTPCANGCVSGYCLGPDAGAPVSPPTSASVPPAQPSVALPRDARVLDATGRLIGHVRWGNAELARLQSADVDAEILLDLNTGRLENPSPYPINYFPDPVCGGAPHRVVWDCDGPATPAFVARTLAGMALFSARSARLETRSSMAESADACQGPGAPTNCLRAGVTLPWFPSSFPPPFTIVR